VFPCSSRGDKVTLLRRFLFRESKAMEGKKKEGWSCHPVPIFSSRQAHGEGR